MAFGNFNITEKLHHKLSLPYFTILEKLPQKAVVELREKPVIASERSLKIVVEFAERGEHLEMGFFSNDPSINRFWLNLCAVEQEHLYGCGEQFSVLDLKGKQLPLWVSEGGSRSGKGCRTDPGNARYTGRRCRELLHYILSAAELCVVGKLLLPS